jgi:phage/plasmid-associated DNA primase
MEIQAKFHMACNVKPRVTDTSNGTWRRLKVIDFPNKFVHQPRLPNELPIDESIMQKVQSTEWAECFMAYLIHLYAEGLGHTKLTPPKEVEAYTSEYQEESDVIARFVREYVHAPEAGAGDPDAPFPDAVSWNTIATTFQTWKRENELMSRGSATDLRKRIEGQFGKMPRGGWLSFRFGPA